MYCADTDKNRKLSVQIVFPLEVTFQFQRHQWKMLNNLSKKIIIWSNEIFRSVNRIHVYKIDDDQLMHADALFNFGCAHRNHSCSPHDWVLWPARLSRVEILQSSADGTNLYFIHIRVANTNGYCQKTNDSCHDTTQ